MLKNWLGKKLLYFEYFVKKIEIWINWSGFELRQKEKNCIFNWKKKLIWDTSKFKAYVKTPPKDWALI